MSTFTNRHSCKRSEEGGFATAEWTIIMMFSVLVFATLVQILLIEYTRTTTMAALRDAARAGAQVTDLRRASEQPGNSTAPSIAACENSARNALADLNGAVATDVHCVIGQDTQGKYYMRASIGNTFDSVQLLPGAQIFEGRLKSLSSTYMPREAAQ